MEVNDTCKSIVHSHNSLLMVLLLEFNQNAIMGNFLPLKNILVFNNWAKWVLIVFCFLRRAGGEGVEGGMCIVQTITWFTRISPNGIICKSRKGRTFFKMNDT